MLVYLLSLPIWNFVLPAYAFWHFDDFSWGETRMVEGEAKDHTHGDKEGEFDSSKIVMKRWCEFEKDKRQKAIALLGQDVMTWHMGGSEHNSVYGSSHPSLVDLGYAAPPTIGNVAMEVDGNVRHSMLPGGILSTAHGSFALPPPIGDVEAGSSASGSSRGGSYKRSHLGMM
jgi:chitin synthase